MFFQIGYKKTKSNILGTKNQEFKTKKEKEEKTKSCPDIGTALKIFLRHITGNIYKN